MDKKDYSIELTHRDHLGEYTPPDYLDEDIPMLVKNQITVLASESGQGKTSLILAMIGRLSDDIVCVYYTEEDKERIGAGLTAIGCNCKPYFADSGSLPPIAYTKDGKINTEAIWASLPPLNDRQGLLVIDTAPNFAQNYFANFNEDKAQDVRNLYKLLQPAKRLGYTILLVAHITDKKDKKGEAAKTIFGSSAWKMEADRTFLMHRTHNIYNIHPAKRRGGQEVPFALQTGAVVKVGVMEFAKGLKRCAVEEELSGEFKEEEDRRQKVINAVAELETQARDRFGDTVAWGKYSFRKIRAKCKMKASTTSEIINQLVEEGSLARSKTAGVGFPKDSPIYTYIGKHSDTNVSQDSGRETPVSQLFPI